jgi:hypothetical protein
LEKKIMNRGEELGTAAEGLIRFRTAAYPAGSGTGVLP